MFGSIGKYAVSPARPANSWTAAALVLAVGGLVPQALAGVPTNDTCASAEVLNLTPNVPLHLPPLDASMAGSDTVYLALFDFPAEFQNAVWYTFTAPSPGYLYYNDANEYQSFENPGTVFSLVADCGDLTAIDYHEIDPDLQSVTRYGRAQYGFLNAGESVYILVASGVPDFSDPVTTTYDLTFEFVPSAPLVNDSCENAADLNSIGLPYATRIDNILAEDDASSCGTIFQGAWFTYTPSWTGTLIVDEFGNALDAQWASGSGCSAPVCLSGDDAQVVAITSGAPIQLLLGTPAPVINEVAKLQVQMALNPSTCSNPLPLPIPGSTGGIIRYGDAAPDTACSSHNSDKALWYSITVTSAGDYTFTVTPDNSLPTPNTFSIDPFFGVAVFTGCPSDGGTVVGCHARSNNEPEVVSLTQHLSPGAYIVMVSSESRVLFHLNVAAAPCPADFNGVNGVTVQDIFDFLTAWLAGSPSADFNHVNGVTVQDIFDFLTAWLAGC